MRIVEPAADLDEAVAAAQREAPSAFGDDRVFLERYVARSRHVEIQILGDAHGNRRPPRRARVLDPAPPPEDHRGVAVAGRRRRPARRHGRGRPRAWPGAIGYRSAGTVEFLVDDDTPASSSSSRSTPASRSSTRSPRRSPASTWSASSCASPPASPLGHDAGRGHLHRPRHRGPPLRRGPGGRLPARHRHARRPSSRPPSRRSAGTRGVVAGSVVGVDFDPMLAKVIAHAPTRAEAAGRLALALERLHLGGVTTNRDFLVADPAHAGVPGRRHHHRLHRPRRPAPRAGARPTSELRSGRGRRRPVAAGRATGPTPRVLATMPSGWRNARMPARAGRARATAADERRGHLPGSAATAPSTVRRRRGAARVHAWSPDSHRRRGRRAPRDGAGSPPPATASTSRRPAAPRRFEVVPRFVVPGPAEVAGGLRRPHARRGARRAGARPATRSTAGQTLVVLEAMKMEHHMARPGRRRGRRGPGRRRRAGRQRRPAPGLRTPTTTEEAGRR